MGDENSAAKSGFFQKVYTEVIITRRNDLMLMQFDGERAYKHVEYLSTNIGARVSGTEGEKKAAEYVQSEFESNGLKTQVLSFEAQNEAAIAQKLEIIEPPLGEIPCLPLVGTPDTPQGGLSAELVFVEGLYEPQVGPHVEGKIVILVNGGLLGRNLRSLLKYRPLGLILVGSYLSSDPNTFHVILKDFNEPYELVPTLHVTYEDAVRLWNTDARKARILLQTSRRVGASHSIVAEVTGDEYQDEIVVIAGHMDTVPNDPGATDNAAGVATVLELARLYAARGSKRTLRFGAWGSEEGSLGGSMKYIIEQKKKSVDQREAEDYIEGYTKTELEKHLLNINLDVLGMSLGNNACYLTGPDALGNYVKALSCELGIHHDIKTEGYGSDNKSFSWADIPAISFAREGVGGQYMHTVRDDIDLIDARQLGIIGNLIDVFITRTAAAGYVWPFKREVPEMDAEAQKAKDEYVRQVAKLLKFDPELLEKG
jgi:aminopeptidase YwaD